MKRFKQTALVFLLAAFLAAGSEPLRGFALE